jgi:hypothetical protein
MARPKKSKQRTKWLKIRVTDDEIKSVDEEVVKTAITRSAYMRKRIFGQRVMSRADDRTLNQLNSHMGLAKHIALEKPELASQMFSVCKHIHDAIRTIEAVYRRELSIMAGVGDSDVQQAVTPKEAKHARTSVARA